MEKQVDSLQLLNLGDLNGAIETARDYVRDKPVNYAARELFAQLLCISGDLERADKQLETIVLQRPQESMGAMLVRQLIRAELARREVWRSGRVPEFIGQPDSVCEATLRALVAYRSNDHQQSLEILEQLADQMPLLTGTSNDNQFKGWRDLDDFCMGILEVLTSTGKYFWIPMSKVVRLEFAKTSQPRDLVWRECNLQVKDGPDGVVYIPAIYDHDDQQSFSQELRLGRKTEWIVQDNQPIRGVGQRTFLVGEDELGIMELHHLEVDCN